MWLKTCTATVNKKSFWEQRTVCGFFFFARWTPGLCVSIKCQSNKMGTSLLSKWLYLAACVACSWWSTFWLFTPPTISSTDQCWGGCGNRNTRGLLISLVNLGQTAVKNNPQHSLEHAWNMFRSGLKDQDNTDQLCKKKKQKKKLHSTDL